MGIPLLARIVSLGSYLPENILSNTDFEKLVNTNDEWITTRTGIKERRIAGQDEMTSDMGAKAAIKALQKGNIPIDEIDLILVATMSSDYLAPATAPLIQAKLNAKRAAAFDIQAACTGYIYALSVAKAFIESSLYRTVLLIASEKMSAFVDYQDRSTCVLFGDGATAAVIKGGGNGLLMRSVNLGADGAFADLATIPAGGAKCPASEESVRSRLHYFRMDGKEVFKHAVRRMEQSAKECMKQAHITESDLSWIVPHQANARIIDALAKYFSLDPSRVYRTVHKYGNTSASSVGIALDELMDEHKLEKGEKILLVAFGVGLTWGSVVLENN